MFAFAVKWIKIFNPRGTRTSDEKIEKNEEVFQGRKRMVVNITDIKRPSPPQHVNKYPLSTICAIILIMKIT
ncbi:hypothetical protein ZWY2020_023775 [Hordeum vulgare]|nr:hypothetical protein ZWY2020_023775 [Hordeum vulgare]